VEGLRGRHLAEDPCLSVGLDLAKVVGEQKLRLAEGSRGKGGRNN
jgi:hypothetical protein